MNNWAGPVRFESPNGTTVVTFSQIMGEWESTQDIQVGVESVHGAHYGHDQWGQAVAPVNPAEERWRALVPNEDVDEFRSTLHRIGRGRLYIKLNDDSERWAWARLNAIPDISLAVRGVPYVPLSLPFTRLSDWYAAAATTVNATLDSSPETVSVTNAGLVETRNITITLTANSAAGFDDVTIANTTTAEQVSVSRTAANGEMIRLDVLGFRLETSDDGGSTWTDITQDLALGGTQVSPLTFVPGGNVITVTGATDADISIAFYSSWR